VGPTIVFRLDCATEVRKRSNETWLKIDYGQLQIRIKSMWLSRVYFVFLNCSARKFWHEATGCVTAVYRSADSGTLGSTRRMCHPSASRR
jgi:hypothetical protein